MSLGGSQPRCLDGLRDRVHRMEDLARLALISNLEFEMLFNGYHQLQSVHAVKTDAIGTKERSIIADFVHTDFQHQFAGHDFFDSLAEIHSLLGNRGFGRKWLCVKRDLRPV